MIDWFDFRKFRIYHWLQENMTGLLRGSHFTTAQPFTIENGWKGRKDAEAAINAYLADLPSPERGSSSTVENSRVPPSNHNSSLHWQLRLATKPCSLFL